MFAWLADQYTAHLYAVDIIRAMPETEIPPLCGGIYYAFFAGLAAICKKCVYL